MLFNSIDFAVFLPIVFILYWIVFCHNISRQNLLIVIASYFFYGYCDLRYLLLIIFYTLFNYLCAFSLNKPSNKHRKILLYLNICTNIGILGVFKYFNFFIENFTSAFLFFGAEIPQNSLNIILPVGISFYAFQSLSYTIDVYREKIKPSYNFIAFAAFISFFPQLVAGPIERATSLLPQFYKKRKFDYHKAVDGLRQILWGLFKKIVIADNCAKYADLIFNNSASYSGSTLLLGAFFFAFQIYGDFSGYSDIAIGSARLFGFDLMRNFAFPYFSRDIAEFWRRWHISLSTWFRDYLYIPLGGSHGRTFAKVRNTFIIFIVSSFWHGPNWTFVAWGVLHAILFLPLLLSSRNRKNICTVAHGKLIPSMSDFISIVKTFSLVTLAWIFFRSENIDHALNYISEIFSYSLFTMPNFPGRSKSLVTLMLIMFFVIVEWIGREDHYAISNIGLKWNSTFRFGMYYSLIFAIFMFGRTNQEFIYFQF